MKKRIKDEKGITLITLAMAIIIMLVIASVLIYNASTGTDIRNLNNMYNDIKILTDKVNIYYAKYNALPVLKDKYTSIEQIQNRDANDNGNYYVIDLEALDNITLRYGKDYTLFKNGNTNGLDVYIVNEQSHTVYYAKGMMIEDKVYYTIPTDSTKVNVVSIATIELQNTQDNTANIVTKAVDKQKGIKKIEIYKQDELYQTFEYDQANRDLKTEILKVNSIPFGKEISMYADITNLQNEITKTNVIILRNDHAIATKEDFIQFSDAVNAGNTYENQIIQLIGDIALKGNQTNQWTPVATTNSFKGTFDGNYKKITGMYINTTQEKQGLFCTNEGLIKNVTVEGSMTTGSYSGGIAAVNKGTILNCTNQVTIQSNTGSCLGGIAGLNTGITQDSSNTTKIQATSGNNIGGIIGVNQGKIEKCNNKGDVQADNGYSVGGIAGSSEANTQITRCENTGNILGNGKDPNTHSFVGGIVGMNMGTVTSSCNKGTIQGINTVGGIIGGHYEDLVDGCYNTGTILGDKKIGGIVGAHHLYSGAKKDYSIVRNCYSIGNITSSNVNRGGIIGIVLNVLASYQNNFYLAQTANGGVDSNDTMGGAEKKTAEELKNLASALGSQFKQDTNNSNQGYPILNWE